MSNSVSPLSHLLFPESCVVCSRELTKSNNHLCSFCHGEIELTCFELYSDFTEMDQLFWGRVQVDYTYAHFRFKKNAPPQKILFALKYQNGSSIGAYFGEEIGRKLNQSERWKDVDLLIPVPLHPKKLFIRGYNQSQAIAQGISEITQTPMNLNLVRRSSFTKTQTGKSRFERWENVANKFDINNGIKKYKHIVLVDDVITTGATIESIIQSIRKVDASIRISVVTLAIA